jgi:hypothetical protein
VDTDGLRFKVNRPDGSIEDWSDEEARKTFLNSDWLNEVGFTVKKTVDKDGWLAGTVYNREGEVVATFVRYSWDDLSGFANKVFDQADKITHDPVVWATIGAFKVYGRGVARKGVRNQRLSSLERDATGKVHGNLPKQVPSNWTKQQPEKSADALRASIKQRKDELIRLGEESNHRRRIGEEEHLLRQVEKRLSGS